MLIVGFCGRARAGKSSATEAMERYASAIGFSAKTYDIGALILRYCVINQLIADKPRHLLMPSELQVMVDVGKRQRDFDPMFWLNQIEYGLMRDVPDIAFIPNIRYENEVGLIRKYRGALVFIKSLNENGSEFISPDRDPNHPSESSLGERDADFHIVCKRGHTPLVQRQSVQLLDYLISKKAN